MKIRRVNSSSLAFQLKALAKDLKIPVIALWSSPNTEAEAPQGLQRQADAVAANADAVLVLRRAGDRDNRFNVEAVKNRRGPVGIAPVDLKAERSVKPK